jgi:hypothetical protein
VGGKAEKEVGGIEKRTPIDFHRTLYRQLLGYIDFDRSSRRLQEEDSTYLMLDPDLNEEKDNDKWDYGEETRIVFRGATRA